nr:unnamed protein product [Spirometra erinaceieuropaei]
MESIFAILLGLPALKHGELCGIFVRCTSFPRRIGDAEIGELVSDAVASAFLLCVNADAAAAAAAATTTILIINSRGCDGKNLAPPGHRCGIGCAPRDEKDVGAP